MRFNLALIYRKPKKAERIKRSKACYTLLPNNLRDFNTIVTTYACICLCTKLLQPIYFLCFRMRPKESANTTWYYDAEDDYVEASKAYYYEGYYHGEADAYHDTVYR